MPTSSCSWFDGLTGIAAASVQSWIDGFRRKHAPRGSIAVQHTGTVEVGFCVLGSTIGLQGMLQAVDREFFVKSIELETIREVDQARKRLEWSHSHGLHLEAVGRLTPGSDVPGQFPLMLTPRNYDMLFWDYANESSIRGLTFALQRAWLDKLSASKLPRNEAQEFYYRRFRQYDLHVDTLSALDGLVYWQRGDYQLHLRIHTKPNRTFDYNWRFALSERDADRLRNNRLAIVRQALDLPAAFH